MLDDNLSRAEAADRATAVSAVSYDVDLDLTQGEETFRSVTKVGLTIAGEQGRTFLDLDAAAVHAITVNDRSVDPQDAFDSGRSRIVIDDLRPGPNVVEIVADCAYQHTGVGLHRVVDPVDGAVYLHTQFEPFDAHRVFACFDQPDLKATVSLSVKAPSDWLVVTNTAAIERNGQQWRFATTARLSTYLIAIVAGPYHHVTDTHGDLELGIYCRKSLAAHLDPEEIFTVTRQGLDFFASEFDYPYPFDKYDQLFVPEFNFGAMENPGCITFSESMVFRSRVTEASYEFRANVILHEMAHMWFGDLVTMRWWDDLWLNESFATYMATHAMVAATRFTSGWVRFAAGTKASALNQDQLPTTHPISADIVDTDAVRLHFDGITYSKGASVLRQLVAWVGEDAFTSGIRGYFPRHEWANAELSDFLGALEQASGRDLGTWSRQWLQTAGANTLRGDFELHEGLYRSFAIAQTATADQPTLRSHRVAVGLYGRTAAGIERSDRIELDVEGPLTEVPALVGRPAPELLLINDDDLTYAKVRLDARSLETLAGGLGDVVDPLARNLCWAATWDMVRDAELATRRYVSLVADHAPSEPDDATLERLMAQAHAAIEAYGDPANRAAARAVLANRARRGLDQAEPSSDRQLIYARMRVGLADGKEELGWVRGLLDGTETVPGLSIDTDLRWQLVAALASNGDDDGGALIDAELERDPTDIGERRAASARASRPSAEAKAAAWELLIEARPHLAMVRSVAGGFAQWDQDDLLSPYVEPYFGALRRVWDERTADEALSLIRGLFPSTLVSDATLAATNTALADDTLPGPARRILREAGDGLRRALAARAADTD